MLLHRRELSQVASGAQDAKKSDNGEDSATRSACQVMIVSMMSCCISPHCFFWPVFHMSTLHPIDS